MADPRERGEHPEITRADRLEQQREQHPPDQATVTVSLTDDGFLRSPTWARW